MKKGVSLIALVLTIVVLIILVSVAVLNSEGPVEEAIYAKFVNDITVVQENVSMNLLRNEARYARDNKAQLLRWVGIIEGYTAAQANENIAPNFNASTVTIQGHKVLKLANSMAEEVALEQEDFNSYYVDDKGAVYHVGLQIGDNMYYSAADPFVATVNNNSSNPGSSNPGSSNPGSSNPGSSNPGSSNPGSSNPGSSNPGSSNPPNSEVLTNSDVAKFVAYDNTEDWRVLYVDNLNRAVLVSKENARSFYGGLDNDDGTSADDIADYLYSGEYWEDYIESNNYVDEISTLSLEDVEEYYGNTLYEGSNFSDNDSSLGLIDYYSNANKVNNGVVSSIRNISNLSTIVATSGIENEYYYNPMFVNFDYANAEDDPELVLLASYNANSTDEYDTYYDYTRTYTDYEYYDVPYSYYETIEGIPYYDDYNVWRTYTVRIDREGVRESVRTWSGEEEMRVPTTEEYYDEMYALEYWTDVDYEGNHYVEYEVTTDTYARGKIIPVVVLKPNVYIRSGNGTADNPYLLGI